MVYARRFGGSMRVGSLVKTPISMGIIIDKKKWLVGDYRGAMAYNILYTSGETHWWTEDHMEVLCK